MLRDSAKKVFYVFREAANTAELLELLRLRYRVYLNSRLKGFVDENEFGIDLDCYDLRSKHFGLFKHENNKIQAVGYQRGVINKFGPQKDIIIEILKRYPVFAEKVNIIPHEPFPCLTYLPSLEKGLLKNFYQSISEKEESLTESTRFLLDPRVRSFRLAKFMAKAVIGCYLFEYDHAITCVNKSHKSFYCRLGFNQFDATKNDFVPISNNLLACLYISQKTINPQLHNGYLDLARIFKDQNQFRLIPVQKIRNDKQSIQIENQKTNMIAA